MDVIGRILRASTTAFAAGCRVTELAGPALGALVKAIPRDGGYQVYGLIADIHIEDDPLVRQLVVAQDVSPEVIEDQRRNRRVPIEMEIVTVGYRDEHGRVYHLLPPRPPLSLDQVLLCNPEEVRTFTQEVGYLRLLLTARDLPLPQLLAAHLRQAEAAWADAGPTWRMQVITELTTLLRDDYPTLTALLEAIGEGIGGEISEGE